ncbi:MAG: FtsX-like permease family protein, partial [Blastocatellia bacterium]|nr:FtsX-like permease family protein [Blastocatellia bacterium]
IQLLSGRNFNQYDTEKSKPVVIINETLARKHFPGEDPIGKIIWPASSAGGYPPKREIIGVVSDIRNNGLNQEVMAEVYLPHSQFALDGMLLLVSTYDNPMATLPAIKAVLKEIDPEIVPYNVRTLDKGLSIELAQPRFNTMLISVFAALALILTTIGLYGSISYSVVQRTHEIGIRIALGANSSSVLRMIVGQGLKLAVLGVGLGLAGAIAVTRLISSMLFNTSTTDPVTFTVISSLIIFTAGLASYFPAHKATKVDPMIAIRNQ